MIVYFMCFARLPYRNADGVDEDNEDLDQLRAEISTWAGIDDEHRVRSDLPEKLYRSLKRLLAINPDERPGAEEILHVLKSPLVFDEYNAYAGPSGLDEFNPRISRADTPSPSPTQGNKRRTSVNYTRPGRSQLSATVMDRSPSPPLPQPMRRQSSEDGAVILRRKLEFPPPPSVGRTPSPQRLMLPPPPRASASSRLYKLSKNLAVIGTAKIIVFCAKAYSLLSPCQPFAADPRVLYPLLCIALLDFSHAGVSINGRQVGLGGLARSVVLLLAHMMVVGVLWRWNRLCAGRSVAWDAV
jgi:serine/threonine protein kinase